jgi:glutathione S-transferase
MITLYDFLPSGNGYKARLVLKYLEIPYRLVEVDILKGESRTPAYLARNPNGRIPLLDVPGEGVLAESHAIISYLAKGSVLIPKDAFQQALMWQWLCFEQYNLEPNIATLRFWLRYQKKSKEEIGAAYAEKQAKGYDALRVLETGLAGKKFLVGDAYSLADIGLYAYTHGTAGADMSLDAYPGIRAWIKRIEALPRWEPITAR